MDLLVLDLEFSTSGSDLSARREIVEVGICWLDINYLTMSGARSFFVKSTDNPILPQDFMELTGIRQSDLAQAIDPEDLAIHLEMEAGRSLRRVSWASYGDTDREVLFEHCRRWKLPYPFGSKHTNIKTFFAFSRGLEREVGLQEALEIARLEPQGDGLFHRGKDDALSAAHLLATSLKMSRSGWYGDF